MLCKSTETLPAGWETPARVASEQKLALLQDGSRLTPPPSPRVGVLSKDETSMLKGAAALTGADVT